MSRCCSSALLLACTLAWGCDDDDEKKAKVPPSAHQGGATQNKVNTGIGYGVGLDSGLAPTHTKWSHVFVIDESTAVVTGRAGDEAVALKTEDKGRTFRALRAEDKGWQRWTTDAEGHVGLATGTFAKGHSTKEGQAPVESGQMRFTTTVDDLSEPVAFFGAEGPAKGVSLDSGEARPALLARELASIVAKEGSSARLAFAVPGGSKQPEPVSLPAGQWVAAPYGRPAQLLSSRGGALHVRPWPEPGEKVPPTGKVVKGLSASAQAVARLSAGPGCEAMKRSFARVGTEQSATMVVIGPDESLAFRLPPGTKDSFGCSDKAVVVETFDPKEKEPRLLRCTLDGKCSEPKNNPFDVWPEEHQRTLWSVPTSKGIVAAMSARKGARWGVYVGTSMDGGETFELPQPVGEGKAERGAFDLGALIGFPDRVVLLLSADVTGTSRRGWYVLSSSDAGATWGLP